MPTAVTIIKKLVNIIIIMDILRISIQTAFAHMNTMTELIIPAKILRLLLIHQSQILMSTIHMKMIQPMEHMKKPSIMVWNTTFPSGIKMKTGVHLILPSSTNSMMKIIKMEKRRFPVLTMSIPKHSMTDGMPQNMHFNNGVLINTLILMILTRKNMVSKTNGTMNQKNYLIRKNRKKQTIHPQKLIVNQSIHMFPA